MKKKILSAVEAKEATQLAMEMSLAMTRMDVAIRDYNAKAQRLFDQIIAPHVEKVNAAIYAAQEWAIEKADRAEDFFDHAPKPWRDSKHGELYLQWVANFADAAQQLDAIRLMDPGYVVEDIPRQFPDAIAALTKAA